MINGGGKPGGIGSKSPAPIVLFLVTIGLNIARGLEEPARPSVCRRPQSVKINLPFGILEIDYHQTGRLERK